MNAALLLCNNTFICLRITAFHLTILILAQNFILNARHPLYHYYSMYSVLVAALCVRSDLF